MATPALLAPGIAARPFALAGECAAAQGMLDRFQTLAFELQDSLGLLAPTVVASRAGVPDTAEHARCMEAAGTQRRVAEDIALAQRYGTGGTPSVIVNRVRYPGGGPTTAQLREVIEAAQKGAR